MQYHALILTYFVSVNCLFLVMPKNAREQLIGNINGMFSFTLDVQCRTGYASNCCDCLALFYDVTKMRLQHERITGKSILLAILFDYLAIKTI